MCQVYHQEEVPLLLAEETPTIMESVATFSELILRQGNYKFKVNKLHNCHMSVYSQACAVSRNGTFGVE